jgi:anaerobic selenocysteine-containing dehydrogenase
MNRQDLTERGLKDGDRIDIHGIAQDSEGRHLVQGFTAVEYDIPKGSAAGYYPEMNAVVALGRYDRLSGTPSYKGVPITVSAAAV